MTATRFVLERSKGNAESIIYGHMDKLILLDYSFPYVASGQAAGTERIERFDG